MFRTIANSRILASSLQRLGDPLYRNAFVLMLASAFGGLAGFAFWLIVARYHTSEALGASASFLALAGLIGSLSSLGLGTGLIRFIPSASTGVNQRINASLTLAGLTALSLGLLFLGGFSVWAPATPPGVDSWSYGLIFLAFTVGFALTPLVDNSFLAARKASYALYRSLIYNGLRLPLPILLATSLGVIGILFSFGVALLLALVIGGIFLLPRLYPGFVPRPSLQLRGMKEMVTYSTRNHTATLLYGLPAGVLPLLVLRELSASSAGHFYVPWIMAGMVFIVPMSTAASLFIEGSHPGTKFAPDAIRSFRFGLLLLIPGVLTLFFFGPFLLGLFGSEYSTEGLALLRILSLSAFFVAINVTFFAYLRVTKRVRELILLSATLGVGIVVTSYFLVGVYGLLGPGLAFLAFQAVVSGYVVVRHLQAAKEVARALIRR